MLNRLFGNKDKFGTKPLYQAECRRLEDNKETYAMLANNGVICNIKKNVEENNLNLNEYVKAFRTAPKNKDACMEQLVQAMDSCAKGILKTGISEKARGRYQELSGLLMKLHTELAKGNEVKMASTASAAPVVDSSDKNSRPDDPRSKAVEKLNATGFGKGPGR